MRPWKVTAAVASTLTLVTTGASEKCIELDTSPDAKSVIYSESWGRLGNCMLLYALMLQLKISLDVDTFISDDCIDLMKRYFTEDSVLVRSLSEVCDADKIVWERYGKHIRNLLVDRSYRRGRTIYLLPRLADNDNKFSGYQ